MNSLSGKNDIQSVHCYAIRRVNPFRGVMQIIECEQGRALSCNGIVWEILVRATSMQASDEQNTNEQNDNERNGNRAKKTYYRFGLWSNADGLMKRSGVPFDGQEYFELLSKCDVLVGHLREHHARIPFALEDDLELWMFDEDDQYPIVLLSSVLPGGQLPSSEPENWRACIGVDGTASQRRFPRADELEVQVMRRAGDRINKHWIRRQPGGEGVLEATGDPVSAEQFPVLLLDEYWLHEEERQCVHDYIRWISPSLLTLQHLDRSTRERIENNLNVQAISIEHHRHLYPEVIDDKLLTAARVQSRIEECR